MTGPPLSRELQIIGFQSEAALEIVNNIYNDNKGKLFIKRIVSDNNSILRALLKHQSNHNKSRLPQHIPEPQFLADPGHRTKTVAAKIYDLSMLSKSQSTCSKGGATRFKMNFGYMLKRNRIKTLQEMSDDMKMKKNDTSMS